ncbi:hypothetical protein MHBO_004523, partial [Bonamia ostreae]
MSDKLEKVCKLPFMKSILADSHDSRPATMVLWRLSGKTSLDWTEAWLSPQFLESRMLLFLSGIIDGYHTARRGFSIEVESVEKTELFGLADLEEKLVLLLKFGLRVEVRGNDDQVYKNEFLFSSKAARAEVQNCLKKQSGRKSIKFDFKHDAHLDGRKTRKSINRSKSSDQI